MSQIMKKAFLTFGLFSLVLVLTSFTTSENSQQSASISFKGDTGGTNGGVKLPGDGKKLDFETGGTNGGVKLPGDGKKLDFETGGTNGGVKLPGDGKKLD